MVERIRIGDLLLSAQLITQEQLEQALMEQRKSGLKLGKIFVLLGYVSEIDILNLLSSQLGYPIVDLSKVNLDVQVAKLLPEAYARKFRALVLAKAADGLDLAMLDPLDIMAIDELQRQLKSPLNLKLINEQDLLGALDIVYRRTEDISALAEELKDEFTGAEYSAEDLDLDRAKVDAPVVKFLRSVFEDAIQVHASDIHFEPDHDQLRIRLRVNGELQEQIVKEKAIMSAIAVRLKIMAELNISERRVPQDGRFNIKVGKSVYDIRLSTLPTQYGESIVMRILDQSTGLLNLKKLGFPEDKLKLLQKLIYAPNGILLVTGPTGSGKSTTLYAVLNELNKPEKKIITVEDPVEYRLPRVNQVQVHEQVGLTFSRALRTILRQDPDIVLIGEMRDNETAEIAMRAALTGHIVLSTLHTNDAPSTALRLMDMQLEGFLISATLRGILAQRLIKKICSRCKEKAELSATDISWLKKYKGQDYEVKAFYFGKGCSYCNHTGYAGRAGVFELLELTEEMGEALRMQDTQIFMRLAKEHLKGKLLADNALELAERGDTTIKEVLALVGEGYMHAEI